MFFKQVRWLRGTKKKALKEVIESHTDFANTKPFVKISIRKSFKVHHVHRDNFLIVGVPQFLKLLLIGVK